jgi:dUTP pyrophosphatase
MTKLKIWKTHPGVKLPQHQTSQSACFDLAYQCAGKGQYHGYSGFNKPFTRDLKGPLAIAPGERALIPTGYILDIPEGYSVRLHARSGTALKQGLVLANAEGVIDSDYVEEVFMIIHNISSNSIIINDGDRVAQAELVKNEEYTIEETPARPVPKSQRMGGFGSTGISTSHNMVMINIPEKPVLPSVLKIQVEQVEQVKKGRGRPKKVK